MRHASTDSDQASPLPTDSPVLIIQPEDLGIGTLFWRVRDAVVVGDVVTGTIVLWNPAAERLFGWTASEVMGCSLEILVPDYLRDAHRTGIARYAVNGYGPIVDGDTPVEIPARHKDGTERIVELSLSPLTTRATVSGSPDHVAAIIRDVTERRKLESEREALLATTKTTATRLEELASLKDSFTAMVAHELAAPMATIRALADLLVQGAVPSEAQAGVLRTIRSEAELVQRLVTDIAATAVVERDNFVVQPRPTPLVVLLANAAASIHTLPGDNPISERITESAMTKQVLADPERISQVLRNLLNNAVKHTPPGTPIELRVHCDDSIVRIEVADAGPGIPADEFERIFAKFGRGRATESHRTPGMGLGLYLSRNIVQAHGSELIASSREGEGTVFGFKLQVVT